MMLNCSSHLQSLQQKEREENEIKMKLEHEHSVLVSKLVELGAANFINTSTSRASPPPPGTTPTEIAAPNEGISLSLAEDQLPSPKGSTAPKGMHIYIFDYMCTALQLQYNLSLYFMSQNTYV